MRARWEESQRPLRVKPTLITAAAAAWTLKTQTELAKKPQKKQKKTGRRSAAGSGKKI
jgi:hypothetical protein